MAVHGAGESGDPYELPRAAAANESGDPYSGASENNDLFRFRLAMRSRPPAPRSSMLGWL